MSASRCLGPAMQALAGSARHEWKAYIDALPEVCPHADCTGAQGCRARVGEYFRMQWHIRAHREKVQRLKASGAVPA